MEQLQLKRTAALDEIRRRRWNLHVDPSSNFGLKPSASFLPFACRTDMNMKDHVGTVENLA